MTKRTRLPIDGVLLLDKPVGPSSTRVLGHVKHLLNAAKAGHGGTLDPMASGLLPLMFGEATKYAAHGLDADKTYEAQIALGSRTTTADREGDVIAQATVPETLSREQINAVLARFMGPQEQVPPMHSALKKDGKALYAYARTGQTVERAPRRIIIHAITLTEWARPLIGIRVSCSKGTYIRTLAEDIGQALGLPSHLHSLRRVAVGDLQAHDMVALSAIEHADLADRGAFLKPVDWLIRDWPAVVLDSPQERQFVHGQAVTVTMTGCESQRAAGDIRPSDHQQVRVQNRHGVFLGTGRVAAQRVLHPERLRVLSS